MNDLKRFYEIYIKVEASKVWDALTQQKFTSQYFYATRVESDWHIDSPVFFYLPDGSTAVEGKVLEVEKPSRLVITWRVLYAEEFAKEGFSKVTFEITQVEACVCKLSVTHTDFVDDSKLYEHVQGWVAIISSLKSLLETGEAIPLPTDKKGDERWKLK